jgi:hypothetical protein
MSAIVRFFRHLGPSQLAVVALSLAACATAVHDEPTDDDDGGGGGPPSMGGSATTAGTNSTAGKPPGTSGTATTAGSAGQVGSGGTPGAGGTAATAGTTATAGAAPTAGSAGTCPPYSGALAKDSAIFNAGFGQSTTGKWSGYGYTYKFGTATVAPGMGTSCFAGKKFCANGTIPADDKSGAGLGWNIGQAMGATATTKVAITTPVKITFAGAVEGMRVQLSESAALSYCYTLTAGEATAGTATIPAASFKSECWGATGVAYAGTPIEAIQISVPGAMAAAKTFDLCVLDIEPG